MTNCTHTVSYRQSAGSVHTDGNRAVSADGYESSNPLTFTLDVWVASEESEGQKQCNNSP